MQSQHRNAGCALLVSLVCAPTACSKSSLEQAPTETRPIPTAVVSVQVDPAPPSSMAIPCDGALHSLSDLLALDTKQALSSRKVVAVRSDRRLALGLHNDDRGAVLASCNQAQEATLGWYPRDSRGVASEAGKLLARVSTLELRDPNAKEDTEPSLLLGSRSYQSSEFGALLSVPWRRKKPSNKREAWLLSDVVRLSSKLKHADDVEVIDEKGRVHSLKLSSMGERFAIKAATRGFNIKEFAQDGTTARRIRGVTEIRAASSPDSMRLPD